MDINTFNYIAGAASIISLLISLFTLTKVIKIDKSVNPKQKVKAKNIINSPVTQIGRDKNGN